MRRTKYVLPILLSVLAVATTPAARADLTDKQFEDAMNKYLQSPNGQQQLGKTVESYFQKRQQEMMKEKENAQKNEIEEQFKNPVKVEVGNAPVKGPANAKITIIEFSDFQCPYCKKGKETMDQVLKTYPNDVKIAFKQLPLEFHKEAKPAAKAALAAGKQGKFWEFHDAMFANQAKLGSDFYTETAKSLGLNMDQFAKDAASPEIDAQITADSAEGAKFGIQGTPGFFVNGVAVKGAYPFEHFKMIIDRLTGKPAA